MAGIDQALQHLETHKDEYLAELFEYLKIPSVSAQRAHDPDSRFAADFVRNRLEQAGFKAGLFEGDGLPTVHASRIEGDGRPTLLLYGHYDVQPPDPLDEWQSPPFEPTVIDGEIRARGCADDKGPSLAMILAAECWILATGSLPVNLKVVIEGEEESGGHIVNDYLHAHRADLAADALVIADSPGATADVPSLCYGLRGLVAAEVTVRGPARDLHSGFYGGAVANPATALARLVASLHDEHGHVAVPGFYEGVLDVDEVEHARMTSRPFDENEFLAESGAPSLFGEKGFTTLERIGARPTCEVNGIFGGYMGEGTKTIVPARAGCKITCRLVPDQDPETVRQALERHLHANCPAGVTVEVKSAAHAPAMYMDPSSEWARKACAALQQSYGHPPALTREGGSIPVVSTFGDVLGLAPLLIGTYAPGERMHSPNERYFARDFFRAIETGIRLFAG
jgi:acetylornithine deacetylase/succinyl-diaminopimelate desuccinylase-like protein